jgi:hypothetical protein
MSAFWILSLALSEVFCCILMPFSGNPCFLFWACILQYIMVSSSEVICGLFLACFASMYPCVHALVCVRADKVVVYTSQLACISSLLSFHSPFHSPLSVLSSLSLHLCLFDGDYLYSVTICLLFNVTTFSMFRIFFVRN